MWFYTVTEFEHQDYAAHHGYYQNKDNAIKAAERALVKINEEQKNMRDFLATQKGIESDAENYPDLTRDMSEDVNHDNFMIWRGGHKEICIHMVKTDD